MSRDRLWAPLETGDLIDIVAPGSGCTEVQLARGLEALQSWGFRTRVPRDLFAPAPFVSNVEEARKKHLVRALRAPDSKAVWCVRGGYGCMHLLAQLASTAAPVTIKPLIGFSDVSALLHGLSQFWGWPSIHGPVIEQLGSERVQAKDLRRMQALLFGQTDEIVIRGLRLHKTSRRRDRAIKGHLCGGNLATLQSLCGTPASPKFAGGVAFFEDVNERGYVVDRMLRTLEAAGAFVGVRAVVFGQFLRADEPAGRPSLVPLAIENFATRLRCPIFTGLPVGHGNHLRPLIVGAGVELAPTQGGRWGLTQKCQ